MRMPSIVCASTAPVPADVYIEQERRAMRVMRWRSFRNAVKTKLAGSRLRIGIAIFCSLFFWAGLFVVFHDGFRFLHKNRLITGPLIELLFGLFFASLLVMLVFSTSIILYGGLFRSEESENLLVRPIPPDHIFAFKFQEAMLFSSWGFLLLGTPMMASYGVASGAPWTYYLLGLPFFVAFALLPGSAGALLTLALVFWTPRSRRPAMIALGLGVAGIVAAMGARAWLAGRDATTAQAWLTTVIEQLRISNLPFLPSQWISKGLLAAAYDKGFLDAAFYLMVLTSNALAVYLLTAWLYRVFYRRGYDRVASSGRPKRKPSVTWLPGIVDRLFFSFSGPVKVLLLKDVRVFARDPLQWLQVVIFSGLLAIYFSNLHRVTLFSSSPYWRNLLGFFNVGVTGLLLAAYTSRFIFPLMSLEGQKFWILGLAPISRRAILWGKFAFSVGGAMIVTIVLTSLSAWMLQIEPMLLMLQILCVLIICFGVSGIAVGLGARLPELNETDPSRIASGFGGTLNLITSLVFIVFVIATMALPCHLYSMTLELESGGGTAREIGITAEQGISLEAFRFWLGVSIAISTVVGVFATLYPMRVGIRAFENREF